MDATDIVELVKGGAGALDAVLKAGKALKEVIKKAPPTAASPTEATERVDDLMDKVLAAKHVQLQLMEAAERLKAERALLNEERAALDDFVERKNGMLLQEVSPNSFAYVHHPSAGQPKQPGFYCAYCFSAKKLSLHQFKEREFYFDLLDCRACGSTIRWPNGVEMTSYTARITNKWHGDF